MSNPAFPSFPKPDRDNDEPDAVIPDEDGEPTLDPTIADDLVDSAEADRLASGGDEEESRP